MGRTAGGDGLAGDDAAPGMGAELADPPDRRDSGSAGRAPVQTFRRSEARSGMRRFTIPTLLTVYSRFPHAPRSPRRTWTISSSTPSKTSWPPGTTDRFRFPRPPTTKHFSRSGRAPRIPSTFRTCFNTLTPSFEVCSRLSSEDPGDRQLPRAEAGTPHVRGPAVRSSPGLAALRPRDRAHLLTLTAPNEPVQHCLLFPMKGYRADAAALVGAKRARRPNACCSRCIARTATMSPYEKPMVLGAEQRG